MDSVLNSSVELIFGFSAQLSFIWLASMNKTVRIFVESRWNSAQSSFEWLALVGGTAKGFLSAEMNPVSVS